MGGKLSHVGKNVSVVWEDAWANSGNYYTPEDIGEEQPLVVEILGRCIRENKDGITLAMEILPDGRFRHAFHVPRGMVRKVRVLR